MMGDQIKEAKITTTPMLLIKSFYIGTHMQNVVEDDLLAQGPLHRGK